jgi:hypothetical protein
VGTSDGTVQGTTKIVDHGSDALRWNLVLVSEGYRSTEMADFATDAQGFVNTLFATAPFDTLQAAINVHRVNVTATDSGADDPTGCGGTGAMPATYFDATFCGAAGVQRLLVVNNTTVINTVQTEVPAWDMILVLVNSTVYGGSGGAVAVFSMAPNANEIGLHEMGHTAFGLADEYEYWAGCGTGELGRNNHPAVEPAEPNVTINTNRATIKWGDLILASTPLPTSTNANCSDCDAQANPQPSGVVGAFEGAHYYHCGGYRPQWDCRMRALNNPFCAVCRRVIVNTLTPHLPTKTSLKDLKDFKVEKIEKLEKLEFKELKVERVEGWEKFRKPERKEFKELKPEVEGLKLDASEVEFPHPDELWERLDRLELAVEQLGHFITREQRPDLSRGALQAEPVTPPPARRSATRRRSGG